MRGASLSGRVLLPGAFLAALAFFGSPASRASAAGWVLDGRVAPDLTFTAGGLNGVTVGTSLSQYRGKVVWVKFWLRDCPICRRTLPEIQEAHARYGKQGLVVLTVLHGFPPNDPPLNEFLRQNGYTFPVGCDVDGRLASQYGVHVRPTDYLIGVDGRVRSSNVVSEALLLQELKGYRLAQLDRDLRVPEALKGVRDGVWNGQLAKAFKDATAAAGAPDASSEVKEVLRRVQTLAEEDVDGRNAYADWLASRRRAPEARQVRDELARDYANTALASRVKTG